jgi:ATP synthase F1 epsilon subunit
MVVATTTDGEVGILPLHAPLVATLAAGEARLQFGDSASDWEYFSISGGYLQVHEDKVILLADNAVAVSQIDATRAKESAEHIEALLAELPADAGSERDEMIRPISIGPGPASRSGEALRRVETHCTALLGRVRMAGSPPRIQWNK